MTWSFLHSFFRRIRTVAPRAAGKRKRAARPRQPRLELLEDRTVPSSIACNFNATAVAPGDTLWFTSVANVSGVGATSATIHVTHQTITFSDTLGGVTTNYSLSVPNADLTLSATATTATTTFNSSLDKWVTTAPTGLPGNEFLAGYALSLPGGLHGADTVTWSAQFSTDNAGISLNWQWAAAAYTSFSTTYSALGVKPCDSNTASSYANSDHAGTPESYKTHVVGGATGGGGSNYTGSYSATAAVTPTVQNGFITGVVFEDLNGDSVLQSNEPGLSGWTVQLYTLTSGVLSSTPLETTTSDTAGGYSFSNLPSLASGTSYVVAEVLPSGWIQTGPSASTSGTTTLPGSQLAYVYPVNDSSVLLNTGSGNTSVSGTGSLVVTGANTSKTETVTLNDSVGDSYSGSATASQFSASLTDLGNTLNFFTFCIDPFHSFTLNTSFKVYVSGNENTAFVNGARMAYIYQMYGAQNLSANPNQATAVQFALWDLSLNNHNPTTFGVDADGSYSSGDQSVFSVKFGSAADAAAIAPLVNQYLQTSIGATVQGGWLNAAANGTGANRGQSMPLPGPWYNLGVLDQPVTISGTVYDDLNANGVFDAGDVGIAGVTLTLTGTNLDGRSVTSTTTTAADGTYDFTTDNSGNLLIPGTYQVAKTAPVGYLEGVNTVGTVNGTTDGTLIPTDKIGSIVLTSGQNGINYNFGEVQAVTISGTVYYDANANGVMDPNEPGLAGITLTLSGTNITGGSITATTTTSVTGTYAFSTDSSGNLLAPGNYKITETPPTGYLVGANTIGTVVGMAGSHTMNWVSGFQVVLNNTDTSGAGLTPGYMHDVVNSSSDDIFKSGSSKDTASVTQWLWTPQKPQPKDDLADAFSASYADPITGHKYLMVGMDRYSASGDSTVGFWAFQNPVSENANGTFNGVHTDGDILLVLDFASGSIGTVGVYRWTGSDATGSLVAYTPPAGTTYAFVNTAPYTVPWSYVDNGGATSPQAGEYMEVGLDYSAVFGANLPRFANFLTESRSSNSVSSTLSDFVIGRFNNLVTPASLPVGTSVSATQTSVGLGPNQNGINYNFALVLPVTIAGTVYHDLNDNGVLDTGEPGIAGATVTLTGTNDLGQSVTATTTTAANGTYKFTTDTSGNYLAPGTYQVTETPPTGYITGGDNVGTVSGSTDGTSLAGNKIGSIVLTSGQAGINYNFGNILPVTIAGFVYEDRFDGGTWSSGDPGIVGVTLTLTGTSDQGTTITATTTTTAGGNYSFTTDSSGNGIRPGTYQIVETTPTGYLARAANVGTVKGAVDGSALSITSIGSIVLTEGQAGTNYLFGDIKPVTVSGLVYQDTNGNGVLNVGEPGIAGVTLTLTGTNDQGHAITATTTTAANGTYSFSTDSSGNVLRPGTYQIVETHPSGYLPGTTSVGTVNVAPDGTVVSSGDIGSIVLAEGQNGINYNFGEVQPVSVSGTVYLDINGTGIYSSSDTGIAGVTVTLSGTNGLGQAISVTATTAANGTFSFSTDSSGNALRPGSYQLVETPPSGYLLGSAAVGTVSGTADGTVSSATKITSIGLTSGQNGINYYFGDVQPVTISGLVYHDINGTGVYSSSDPGIAGVTLTLSGTNGLGQSITATTTTAAGGAYSFTTDSHGNALRPGSYQVVETPPSGYLLGSAAVGTVSGTADGTVASASQITSIALTSGQSGINYLFGDVKQVSISGTVYVDIKGTGVYSSSDPGIAGVTLTLSGTNNLGQAITATTTTATNGTYSFSTDSGGNALRPGTYQITETQPSGYLPGATAVGTVSGATDGTVVATGQIGAIALTSGQSGINYNFGEVKQVSISGTVYIDTNGTGVYSSSDPGVAGVTLTLSGANNLGQSISVMTTTAADGTYSFTLDGSGNALRPGTYQITETPPSGYLAGATTVGTVSGSTDGTVVSSGTIGSIALTSGQNGIKYNFGEVQPVTISGLVYQDISGTGAYSLSDPGIAGVTLTLSGTNGLGQAISATATTASGGTFSFSSDSSGNPLRPGTYQVVETPPSGYLLGSAAVGTVSSTADGTVLSPTKITSIGLTSGQNGINYYFGDVLPVTIAGTVYVDTNDNGVFDAGEPGIANVTLTLSGTNNLGQTINATTTTAANGAYTFSTDSHGNALRPGTYQVTETQPSSYLPGATTVGTVSGSTDGIVVSFGNIGSIALTSGQSGMNYNFGQLQPVTISGIVYVDSNGTDVYSSSDPGIAAVTLTLSGTNDKGASITATVTTAANGTYSFSIDSNGNALRPGTYQVVETQPSGYLAGATAVGTVNGATDGSVVATGTIGSIVLAESQSGINYNFGEVQPVTISGSVYLDTNGNGVFDTGDLGMGGITLTLSGTNGLGQSITATTTTAADGSYSFSTDSAGNVLRPGTYQVTEAQPSGYLPGATNVGTVNGAADGTVVATGQIGSIALTSGQNGIHYNFGEVQPVTIAGTVYLDVNGIGVIQPGDAGFPNVTLTLTGTTGMGQSITATTVTAADGTYSFSTDSSGNVLLPGTYQITETKPAGYVEVAANVGTVNGKLDGAEASPGKISSIVMASGQNGVSYNFGLSNPASVQGYVYIDTNRDGVFDTGDGGLSNVTVTLTGTDVFGNSVSITTTTDVNGYYIFTGLSKGTYTVTLTAPGGNYNPEVVNVGTVNSATDGVGNTNLLEIDSVLLTWGNAGVNYNFGLTPPLE
jgi:hypothetical protein